MLRFILAFVLAASAYGQSGGQLRFCLRAEPKTFNPLLVDDESSETVRYLTGGVLIRLNRLSQQLEPELAIAWKVSEGGRRIDLQLRPNVRFSDGTPFSCEDVAYTVRQLMDPNVHSPTGDAFRSGPGAVETRCTGANAAMARFPAPVSALAAQFDQVAIVSASSPHKDSAVLGPFEVGEYKPGAYVELARNPNYWKRDSNGKRLPYFDSIHLDIQTNRELELLRFRRGQLDIVNKLDPEMYERLSAETPKAVVDAGPSLDWELIFFNQVPGAPLPEYKKAWFRSSAFRHAISQAINRDDLCRIVFRGHAKPAVGPASVSNRFWLNAGLKPHAYSPQAALDRLSKDGFRRAGEALLDRGGNRVEFSMITNAGNKLHERMLTLIQQDLAKIGVKLNVVILDFPSLIERITRTFDYESSLMNITNMGLDPNDQTNIWLSSAANHPWNPNEKTPATPWEAEIDRLMVAQSAALDNAKRKVAFDRVQQIVWDEAPMLFLVNADALAAVSPSLRNVAPAALRPQIVWNVERLYNGAPLVGQR